MVEVKEDHDYNLILELLSDRVCAYFNDLVRTGLYREAYNLLDSTSSRRILTDNYVQGITEALYADTKIESVIGRESLTVLWFDLRLYEARMALEACLSLKDLDRSPIERLEGIMEKLSQDTDLDIRDKPKQRLDRALLDLSIHATKLYLDWLGIEKLDKVSRHATMAYYDELLADADET